MVKAPMAEALSSPQKIVLCPLCNYSGEVSGLKLDYSVVQLPTEVVCPKCGAKVPIESVVWHMRRHVKVTGANYVCDICGFRAKNMNAAMRHVKEHMVAMVKKGPITLWVCLACGRVFRYREGVLTHLHKFHERPTEQ